MGRKSFRVVKKRSSLKKRRGAIGKKSKVQRKSGSRRHIKMIFGGAPPENITGTNDLANYYFKKSFGNIGRQGVNITELKKIPEGSVLWVIDMQNDFIDNVVKNGDQILYGPGGIGAFAVSEGKTIINRIITFISENHENFDKIIFTRDWHPPDHCSFTNPSNLVVDSNYNAPKILIGTGDGQFPPHCIYNTLGAAFAPDIVTFINDEKHTAIKAKIDVLFKGHHKGTDSFTAQEWINEQYPFEQRQNKTCCPSIITCKNNTGGRRLKDKTQEFEQVVSDRFVKFTAEDTEVRTFDKLFENKYEAPVPTGKGQVYVIGLAGEFCVKDTAINLNQIPNLKGKVHVIQDLTRYVFLPVTIGFQRYVFDEREWNGKYFLEQGEWKDETNPLVLNEKVFETSRIENNQAKGYLFKESSKLDKPLSMYLFSYLPGNPSGSKRLTTEELGGLKIQLDQFKTDGNLVDYFKLANKYWHFTLDHRTLIRDYNKFGVKLLSLPGRENADEFVESAFDDDVKDDVKDDVNYDTFRRQDKFTNDLHPAGSDI